MVSLTSRIFIFLCTDNSTLGSSFVQSPLAALSLNPCKTSVRAGSAEARERRRHDPFLSALSRQRKAANLSRRQELAKERDAALGNPVESKPTQFIEKIQAQMNPEQSQTNIDQTNSVYPYDGHNNHFLRHKEDVLSGIEYAQNLSRPVANPDRDIADPQAENEGIMRHAESSATAETAVQRIVDIRNGTSKDRLRVNFMTCIESFGRHNTDKSLSPKPRPEVHQSESRPQKTPRVGPDTGSPEVQIAILTAKILNLSRHLQTANTDKHNKRNLRILVHKRQKMLKYLRRKERGGPRYQKVMEDLGLSDAAWKGEISM